MTSTTKATRWLPRRAAAIGLGLVTAMGFALGGASQASAATDNYCNGCQIYNGSQNAIYTPYFTYLTGSYVHYLGTGNRLLGAGSIDYANFVQGINEAYHPYAGNNYIRAAAVNLGPQSAVTVNAHGTY